MEFGALYVFLEKTHASFVGCGCDVLHGVQFTHSMNYIKLVAVFPSYVQDYVYLLVGVVMTSQNFAPQERSLID